ncbi:hypothetical protein [Akkermansia glycaniphila]|uniref:Uncharacterized protein n=2 Tax=Akkermansia TaxID=239934 RepID=A0A1C7PAW3_9BACT|nr:hypothetical protein [Akkermansia glycaniphila]OCA02730.1 hypothetical protein AC781_08820 [Akkermansia glycaniphila]SEH97612.1 Hypothetical protein PYTT_2229 [Akkermansia glycaniphila]
MRKLVSTLTEPTMQATRAADLLKDFDAAAENWNRITAGKKDAPTAREGAELFGLITSLISSARYTLPPGYRTNLHLQMQWAATYAALAENGEIPLKGTLQTGDAIYRKFEANLINHTATAATPEETRATLAAIGTKRLDRIMADILDRIRYQLARYAKQELWDKTMRRIDAAYPKQQPGKKPLRGKMEADHYRRLALYRDMLQATADQKLDALTALEALYAAEENDATLHRHETDLLAWATYGHYEGMTLPQAQAAMKNLLEYTLTGRNAWDIRLAHERGRAKHTSRQIQSRIPEPNSAANRAETRIAEATRLRRCLASLPNQCMSYSQTMLALEPVLGPELSCRKIDEIATANAALLNATNDRNAWLYHTVSGITGARSENEAEQWLVDFDTPHHTGITLRPHITIKTTLTLAEAREWLRLTPEQRAVRREETARQDAAAQTVTENIPQEQDIPLIREALARYDQASPAQQERQQKITVERTVPDQAATAPLRCSRDCALYAILLHEQTQDYGDIYSDDGTRIRDGLLRHEGLDDEGIAALYQYVGEQGLAYGYALRARLHEQGLTLAQIYETRMGVPFTFKDKYYRATFDRNTTQDKDTLASPANGPIGSGKYGMLIPRRLHRENLDWSKSASLVFLAASAEQDNYIYTSHITADWRTLLRDKQLHQKLTLHLGQDTLHKLSCYLDLIDGATLENNRAFLNLSRLQSNLQRAFAYSVLAGNGFVLLKQATAVMHGFFAGWVPTAILEKADETRELAHRHIGFAEYLYHFARSKLGAGDITIRELAATPWIKARLRGEGDILAQIANQLPGQRHSRLEKFPEKAMALIEKIDVKANLLAMHALANAYYASARKLNTEQGSPYTDHQLKTAALRQIGHALELGAQPLTKTQKSIGQAAGGLLSRLAYIMRSEQINKLGLIIAQWKSGSTRNRVSAVQSWLTLGVTSSLICWLIDTLRDTGDDDDKNDQNNHPAKKLRKYGATALLGDLTSIPLVGEGINYLAASITGERAFADSYSRTLLDIQGITSALKKETNHLTGDKQLTWDKHFDNLVKLARAAGVGGIYSRSPSQTLSTTGSLLLTLATGANISKTAKDFLGSIFKQKAIMYKNKTSVINKTSASSYNAVIKLI